MAWTKRQLITQAFEEIGLASYVFDLDADQLESAKRRMDTMMAAWSRKGIRLGYALPSSPMDSDIDDDSGLPDTATEAVYLNLGLKIGPSFGKTVSLETKIAAKRAYDELLIAVAFPAEMQLPGTLPRGAGSKNIDYPFVDEPEDTLAVGNDASLDFNP